MSGQLDIPAVPCASPPCSSWGFNVCPSDLCPQSWFWFESSNLPALSSVGTCMSPYQFLTYWSGPRPRFLDTYQPNAYATPTKMQIIFMVGAYDLSPCTILNFWKSLVSEFPLSSKGCSNSRTMFLRKEELMEGEVRGCLVQSKGW